MVKTLTKGILSIIGSCAHQICLFSLFTFSNFSVYIISYLRHYDSSLRLEHGYFLGPFCCFTMNCFNFLGGVLDNKFGVHITILSGSSIIVIASILLLISNNLYFDYATMFLFGLGFGLACMTSFKNACRYFRTKQGVITSIIGACGNLGASLYNFIGAQITNPDQVQADENDFYPFDIAKRFHYYLYFKIGSISTLSLIAAICIFQYKAEYSSSNEITPIKVSNESSEVDHDNNNSQDHLEPVNHDNQEDHQEDHQEESSEEELKKKNEKYIRDLKKAFTTSRVWFLFGLFFCTSFGTNMISTTFFTFGTKEHIDTTILTYTAVIYYLGSCIFGFIWGIVYDKFGFKVCILSVTSLGIICSSCFYFSKDIPILFACLIILNGGISSGTFSILFPHVLKVFSPIYSTETYGIISMSVGCSSVLSAIFAFVVTKIWPNVSMVSYMCIYLLGGGLSTIAFILGLWENDEEFQF